MADQTFKQALQQTRDNLVVMGQLCHTEIVKTLPYVEVEGNTLPIIDFVVTGMNERNTAQAMQTFTVTARMRVVVDQFLAGYEGNRQQDAYFDYLPTVLQYFAEHPRLNYSVSTVIPWLDELNTAITSANINTDDGRIVIILNWNWVYNTAFQPKC